MPQRLDLRKVPGYKPPGQRPKCIHCKKDKPQNVQSHTERVNTPNGFRSVTVPDAISYNGVYGLFCSLRCAARFGLDAYKSGYRTSSGA